MHVLKSLCIALGMYSRIPVPRVDWTETDMKYALCFFPAVGVVEGILFLGLWKLCKIAGFGALFRASLLTALPVFVTGGIHVDGFLDTMDALGSWQPRERKLEILKDSHTGAFAIIGGAVYFVLYLGAVSEISGVREAVLIGMGFVLSRILSAGALVTLRGAKKEGMAYVFMSVAHKQITCSVLTMELILTAAAMCFCWLAGAVVMIVAAAGTWLYYRYMAYKEFGGITGDLAGFFLQICEVVMLYGVVIAGRMR